MPQEENSSVVGVVAILAILVIVGAIIFIVYRKAGEPAPAQPNLEINLPGPSNPQQPQSY